MSRRKFTVLMIFILTAAISAAGCDKSSHDKGKESFDPPMAVTVAEVKSEDIERRIDITGTLAPWEESAIASEVEGRIASVRADLGDRVKRGAALATVSPEEYALKAAQADAELTAAQANFKRIEELFNKGMATQQQGDDEKRKLDVARANADFAHKKLNDTSIRSPIEGAVFKRLVNVGEYVKLGTLMFQVVRTSPLKFRGDVPERFTGDVRLGDEVLAYLQSDIAEPLHGKIVRISPAVSADTRSFSIEAEIDNPEEAVKPGSFARVSILTKTVSKAMTIPETAVFTFAGNPRVFVVEGGKARERVIETDGKNKDRVLVAKGLSLEDKVVAAGVELLTDGRSVTIRQGAGQ